MAVETVVKQENGTGVVSEHPSDHVPTENGTSDKKLKEKEKRRRRKLKKAQAPALAARPVNEATSKPVEPAVEVQYVSAKPELLEEEDNPFYQDFLKVFEKFSTAEQLYPVEVKEEAETKENVKKADSDDSDEEDDKAQAKEGGVSNKKKKAARRMKIAELKQICPKPDVVEVWDTTAADPRLLVHLKAYRNSVPVPRHWSQKRKYLQGKRGIEKPPWQLPDFIAATGISKLRQAYIEKEDAKKLKQKQKDRMQPKMGKMDIDYQVLHDAFFKYQTKPKLTPFGDLYHEGKEFEVKPKDYRPGALSKALKEALGMQEHYPAPWLINMQRYGPPPAYPQLKIPGLNAPIPEGAQFGYQMGGWGKPPVDEYGRPLYGDVFGIAEPEEKDDFEVEEVDRKKRWGDMEEEEEVEEEEEDEEEEEEEEEEGQEGLAEEDIAAGVASVDTISTTPAGVETPDVIDLRKGGRKEPEKPLYQVLEEREARVGATVLMGSSHTYHVPGASAAGVAAAKKADAAKGPGQKGADKVDITLRPEELEGLDDVALAQKYEQAREEEKTRLQKEDLSDMVAEQERKRKRKMGKEDEKKKKKDFKF